MRAPASLLAVLLFAATAHAQAEAIFGSGKPPLYSEHDVDRHFARSKLARGLAHGTKDEDCAQLLGGLFTALAETAPFLHKRDENFYLDPALLQAVGSQLTTPRFPAGAYLASMVRRVWIDGRLPADWLSTATQLNGRVQIIDLERLRLLADGLSPIDSFYLSPEVLARRFDVEVRKATSAARGSALANFRRDYLDRSVAWGGLTLVDLDAPKRGKPLEARLVWEPLAEEGRRRPKPLAIEATLSPRQFVDLSRLPKGQRLMVRGRLRKMNDTLSRVDLQDAQLFLDRDFSKGLLLAAPGAVARCDLAINELAAPSP